jgi:hypothetical protein
MRVFLEESVEVARPLEAVWGRFLGDGSWFAPLATAAEEDGEALYFRVGPSLAGGQVARKVRVILGPPHNRGEAIVVPLSWQANALPGLFPVLDGDLVVAAIDAERCRVTLTGSYEPPLGEVGRQLDRALLHRVAHSTVRAFLDRVAASLEADTSGNGRRAPRRGPLQGQADLNDADSQCERET